ncbi:Tom22-domain-containing protein [Hypomontagnella submonticulosa]|nr:Tom22-domain-containing protein [Hypomontagnella submonticulosa]
MDDPSDFEEFPLAPPNSPIQANTHRALSIFRITDFDILRTIRTLVAMVQLTEVVDEHFQEGQAGPEDDDEFTDTESEISNESDYDPSNETLAERLYALKDIIPPQTRTSISNKFNAATGAISSVLSFGGKTLWVLSTSALILGVPWALAWAEEQQVIEMEKEMKMREMGGEILTSGGQSGSATAQQVNAALGKEAQPSL